MESISRRDMLAATAAGGLLTAASVAAAQTVEGIPRRTDHGGTDPGPRNLMRDGQNPDVLVPPATDHGSLPNLRFSFSDAPMRLETGGWTRQVTARDLGVSKNIAGVNMRLNRGGVRELHWHKAAEWAYLLYGNARITAVDAQGRNFVDDVGVGDLWYFPSGIPHSIQGLEPDGVEFLLVFDDGDFDENNMVNISDWFQAHAERSSGEKFRRAGRIVRPYARSQRALYLCRCRAGAAQRGQDPGSNCSTADVQPPVDGAGTDQDEQRNGADQ